MTNKKPKFVWKFTLNEDHTELQIDLNDGINKIIHLAHPMASQYIAETLAEIMRYQFDIGTKTEVWYGQNIYHALSVAKKHLESYEGWQAVINEADQKHKQQQGEK